MSRRIWGRLSTLVLTVAAVAGFVLASGSDSGSWTALPSLLQARSGASATLMPDGRLLVAGGRSGNTVLNSVEAFDPAAGAQALPPMVGARADHTATALNDGRVLVTGGTLQNGTASIFAEVYSPSAGVWTALLMTEARTHHTATKLEDGRVLIVGGDASGAASATMEIFDPATDSFMALPAGLPSGRTRHAAATLPNGRVLVAGGSDGAATLSTTVIVDPLAGTVTPGPSMNVARANFTATGLLNGDVLLVGGTDGTSDLSSVDRYIDATGGMQTSSALQGARQGHVAVRLPFNNGVLIAGGTSSGQGLIGAEVFLPASGTFVLTENTAGDHVHAMASATATPGRAVLAGGDGTTGAELFHYATVQTDKDDYAPFTPVLITGTGWLPGEVVTLSFQESPEFDTHDSVTSVADGNGRISNSDFAPDWHDIGISFILTARGQYSEAQATFKDNRAINFVTLASAGSSVTFPSPGGTLSLGPNATVATTVNVTTDATGSAVWGSTGYSIGTTPPGAVTCFDNTNHNSAGTFSESFNITAPSAAGTYNVYVIAYSDSACTLNASAVLTATSALSVGNVAVASLKRAVADPISTTTTTWTAIFNTTVTGVNTADFAVGQAGGLSGASVTTVAGSGNTYTITANTGSGNGTLGLNLVDDDSIVNGAAPLGGAGTGNGNFTGEVYNVDKTAPTVTNVSSATADGTYGQGTVIPIDVTFSEAVNVTGTPQLALALSPNVAVNYSSGSGTTTLTFNYTVAAGQTSADLNYAATNSLSGTIKDLAGNAGVLTLPALAGAGSLGTNNNIVIDSTAPTVTDVTSTTANGTYGVGTVIPVTVTFSKVVTVTGTPRLTLAATPNTAVNYTSGSGTNTLEFDYTVVAGNSSADLNYASTSSLALNGGTIKDAPGNSATLTLPTTGGAGSLATNKNLVIDAVVATVTNITSTTTNGTYGVGTVIPIQVSFSRPVTVTGSPQLLLETGAIDENAVYTSGSGTTTLTFTYTVATGDGSADLNCQSTSALGLNGGTIKDSIGNDATLTVALSGSTALAVNKSLVIDAVAPTVTNVTSSTANGSYGAGAVISIQVTFSETVAVTGTPQLTLATGTNAVVNYVSGSGGATLTFTYTVAAGQTATDLDYISTTALALNGGTIKDGVANAAVLTLAAPGAAGSLGANKNLVVDTTAATVTDVTSSTTNGTYGIGTVIPVQVTFSEPVAVTSTPQLTLAATPNVVVNYSSGTGTSVLTFNYTVTAGQSSSDLNYAATSSLAGTIKDLAGNAAVLTLPPLAGPGSLAANKDFVIDTVVPVVTNVTSATIDGSYGVGTVIPVDVTFSKAVNVTGTPRLTLAATPNTAVNYTSGSGTTTLTFAYTVVSGNSSADLNYAATTSLALNSGTIKDAAGNSATLTLPGLAAAGSLATNKNIVIDGVVPTVSDVTSSTANGTYITGSTIAVQVVFSEAVTVTGTPLLTLSTGGAPNAIVSYASGSGTTTLVFDYTVAATDASADLDYTATTALALNGGTIKDAVGNNATVTLATPGALHSLGANKALVIDAAPKVTNVTSATTNGTYGAGAVIPVTMTFTKAVTVTGTPQLTLEAGASDAVVNYTSGSGTTTLTFAYTVASGQASADLDYALTSALSLNGGAIKDAVANPAILTLALPGAAGSLGANKALVVDAVAPVVTGVSSSTANGAYTTGAVIPILVTFSKAVTITGTPQLTLAAGSPAVVNYASGTGTTTLTFNYTVGAGQTAADLDYASTSALALNGGTIKDTITNSPNVATLTLPAPGDAGSIGASKDLVIDTTPPTVQSIVLADATPTSGAIVHWTVTFSENVTGVDTTDFAIASSGLSGTPAVTDVTGSGTLYTVTASTGGGTGNIGLNLVDDDSIVDVAGLKLGGAGAGNGSVNGPSYGVDRTLTAHITVSSKTYDATPAAAILTRSLTGPVVNGDDVSLSGGTATFADSSVGTGKTTTATGLALAGADAAKYVLASTSATASADITAQPLSVSGVTANSKPYDGTTAATLGLGGASLVGAVSGDAVSLATGSATGAFDTGEPGVAKTVTIAGLALSGASATNYTLTQPSATADITPAVLTPVVTANSRPYDSTAIATLSSQSIAGVLPTDEGQVELVVTAAAFDTAAIGTSKVVTATGLSLAGGSASRYALASSSAVTTADITPRAITVTADAKTKSAGDPDPALTYSVTTGSMVSGDALAGALTRAVGQTVGTYAISQGTLSAGGNYALTFVGATLTIEGEAGVLEFATSTNTRSVLTASDLQTFLPERGRFTFPAPYNTTGVRLTNQHDCSEFYDCVNAPTGGSWRNMNNSAGSNFLYVVLGLDKSNGGVGPSLFRYNKATGETLNMGGLFDPDDDRNWGSLDGWYFSPSQPTTFYIGLDNHLQRYDVLARTTSYVFDIAPQFGDDKEIFHAQSSNDDRVHSFMLRLINTQEPLGCGVFREDTQRFSYFPAEGKFHECQIDKSGQWLLIKEDRDNTGAEDNRIVDLNTGAETVLLASQGAAGSSDNGYGSMVAVDATAADPGTIRTWTFGPLAPGQTVYHSLADLPPSFTQISFANARSAALDQQYACGGVANRGNGPRANEIACVRLDGSLTTLTIAPTMTDLDALGGGPDDDVIKQPFGNLDPTGEYFLWTSNLLSDRLDAFLVRVPAARLVTPPSDIVAPAVAITAPSDTATVSGTASLAATATDNIGVAGVQFQIDGVNLGAELTADPFAWSWDTTTTPDGVHVLTAIARDAAGNYTVSLPIGITVLNTPDVPQISAVNATGVIERLATISWRTNQLADSLIEYGPTAAYGLSTPVDPALVAKHLVTLNGLTPGSTYHYRVTSKNAQGAAATSGDFTFTTLSAPVISGVAASAITPNSVTVSWTTDIASNSFVEFGRTIPQYGDATNPDDSFVTSHEQGIFGMDPGTLYHFRVYSVTPQGVLSVSQDFTFTTVAPPAIASVATSAVTHTTATVNWTTDEIATSEVQFGVTAGYGSTTGADGAFVTEHSKTLTGLAPGTLYHYRVLSSNAFGLVSASADGTFTTPALPVVTPVIWTNLVQAGVTGTILRKIGGCAGCQDSGGVSSQILSGDDGYLEFTATDATSRTVGLSHENVGTSSDEIAFALFLHDDVAEVRESGAFRAQTTYSVGDVLRVAIVGGVVKYSLNGTAFYTSAVPPVYPLMADTSLLDPASTVADAMMLADAPVPSAPVISGVVVSGITGAAATIAWTTDHAASSQVEYGLTAAYGSTTTLDPAFMTAHGQTLGGLAIGTTYHYRMASTDTLGTTGTSDDATFTTVTVPVISAVDALNLTGTTATIVWTTDQPADSLVEYGPTTDYGGSIPDGTLVTAHSRPLGGLTVGTTYHYRLTSTNSLGMTVTSGDFTFTTVASPQISSVSETGVTGTGATITWTTDQAATSQVEYGLTLGYGATTTLDTGLMTSHAQPLGGLTLSTTYHYRVISTNSVGLTTTSGDFTLTTVAAPAISAVSVTGITGTAAIINWTTDQAATTQVEYGLTTDYGTSTTVDPALVTGHSLGLAGLAIGTTYHYRVVSANSAGVVGKSDDDTFTSVAAPVISSVASSGVTGAAATIEWTTDQAASSQVEYGLTTDYGSTTTADPALATSHSQSLSALTIGTTYHYRVISTNSVGVTARSGDVTFATVAAPIISAVSPSGLTGTAATIGWTTDQTASSQVEYGLTTDYGSTTTLDPVLATSHSQSLSGLTIGTTYHYRVISTNSVGVTATSIDSTVATIALPVISAVGATAVTGTSASIDWTTDQGATSQVEYGLTTDYGSTTTVDPALVTTHSVSLGGLAIGTTYHYRVMSSNSVGLATTSGDVTMTTIATPAISAVAASNLTGTAATISWTTDQGATSQVEYGLTAGYGSTTTADPALVTSHSQGLAGLTIGTVYHYRVISTNSVGLTATSDDFTVTSLAMPVITAVAATSVTGTTATIGWTTDQGATSQIEYGLTPAYGNTTALNPALVTAHSQAFVGLSLGTTYHYRVISTNSVGLTATSDDFTVTTATMPSVLSVNASAVTGAGVTISWTTDQASSSQVEYGLTTGYGSSTTLNGALVTTHSQGVTGLTAGTTYHFRVRSLNSGGLLATSTDFTITTVGPTMISGVSTSGITGASATVTWATDQSSSSQVEYGLTTDYGSTTTIDTALVYSHSVGVTGLAAGTLYHYRVRSTNGAGLLTVSADMTMTTVTARNILVVAPHPDDDIITAAGVTATALSQGATVTIAYMTNGDACCNPPGVTLGLQREAESVNGQAVLGVAENNLLFLGYPDSYLTTINNIAPNADQHIITSWGQSTTYANRGLGSTDWHSYKFGAPAQYNAANIVEDLASILQTYRPDDVYTTAEFDQHPDHSMTYAFVQQAIAQAAAADGTYHPILHKTIVHSTDPANWPGTGNPQSSFTEPPSLSGTSVTWATREEIAVPASMQSLDLAVNPKARAIAAHVTQGGLSSTLLAGFLHNDEFFWQEVGATPTPVLSITPEPVAFGASAVGATASMTITIANTGTAPLTIAEPILPAAPFGTSGLPAAGAVIDAGSSVTAVVTFTPSALTPSSGLLVVQSDGGNATVMLTGTGATASAAVLSVTPSAVAFSDTAVNSTSSRTITIANLGNTSLTINSIDAPSAPFGATGLPANGTVISAGGSITATVTFTPATATLANGSLVVHSTAGDAAQSLTGAGALTLSIPSPLAGGWQLNGSATIVGSELQLTQATPFQHGSAFWPTPVASTDLTVDFDTTITGGNGADGMTFAMIDPAAGATALGNPGGALGFSPLSGVAVTFDTYQNGNDPSSNFVGIATGWTGTVDTLVYAATNTTIPNLQSGTHHVTVVASGGRMTVRIDGTLYLDQAVTLPPTVLLGFTGGTGGLTNEHIVSNVSILMEDHTPRALLAVTPNPIDFGAVAVETTVSQTITITNVGDAPMTFTGITMPSMPFDATGLPAIGSVIGAGDSVTATVMFTPTAGGAAGGSLVLLTDGGTVTITLSGAGTGG